MNKYIRSTGLYAFLFPASLKAPGQTAAEKIEQLKPEFIHRERRMEIYLELFIVFLTAGALLLWIMRFLFNLCVADWIASPIKIGQSAGALKGKKHESTTHISRCDRPLASSPADLDTGTNGYD